MAYYEKKKKMMNLSLAYLVGLDFHMELSKSSVHIEINSNREAIIDGSSGILEYNECCIKISTGKMIVAFKGRGLFIRCMSDSSMVIEGYISSVEYVR